jgi:hypothetical protein
MLALCRQIVIWCLLYAAAWAVIVYAPAWRRIGPTLSFNDIDGLQPNQARRFPGAVPADPAALRGQAVAFRVSDDPDEAVLVGWVAGTPGQVLTVSQGALRADGALAEGWRVDPGEQGPTVVPRGHVFIVTHRHQVDSFRHGPIPLSRVIGLMGDLP